ncbi:cytochrome oxidase putative small subunit CydP [Dyella sp. GSA-30]|uniref:cytochrome oxidase putative small subunit CydP n=1 Tax=Dyella sp. GSA-30 TaxID=2994496 RepID=UPI002492BA55|nr:cytochrome oxidase putative small subunit CydP [Dyella sp. GSA-30]
MTASVAVTQTAPARRRPLRRLALELILLVIVKIAVLTLIWWVAIAPHPRPDASPQAIEHLLAPATSSSSHGGHP